MKTRRRWFYITALGVLSASAMLLASGVSRAYDDDDDDHGRRHRVRVSDLEGSWAISIGGNTGCGLSSMYVTVDLDSNGFGMATTRGSSTGCPPSVAPPQPFQVQLNPDGSGTAGLVCGPGCGWNFIIQVPDGITEMFTLVDVDNPNNVLVGTAARKW